MNNVFSFDPKAEREEKRKEDLLEILDTMKELVKEGKIKEFVASSIDDDGSSQIHVCCLDLPGAIGLFEIGKHLLIRAETTGE